jgi:hypothetical protein
MRLDGSIIDRSDPTRETAADTIAEAWAAFIAPTREARAIAFVQ